VCKHVSSTSGQSSQVASNLRVLLPESVLSPPTTRRYETNALSPRLSKRIFLRYYHNHSPTTRRCVMRCTHAHDEHGSRAAHPQSPLTLDLRLNTPCGCTRSTITTHPTKKKTDRTIDHRVTVVSTHLWDREQVQLYVRQTTRCTPSRMVRHPAKVYPLDDWLTGWHDYCIL
jgi:hypothetical protein